MNPSSQPLPLLLQGEGRYDPVQWLQLPHNEGPLLHLAPERTRLDPGLLHG